MRSLNQLEERHVASLADLRGADSITLLDERQGDIGPGFIDAEPLDMFEDGWSDLRVDPEMLDESLRFEIAAHWESAPSLPEFSGEFRIPSPMEMVTQGPSPSLDMLSTEFQREFVSHMRYFDNAYESSRGFMTFLRMEPGSSPLEVWFSDLRGTGSEPYPPGYVRLDLTFTEYVETLLVTKGLYGWQYLFADVSFSDPALEQLTNGLRNGLNAFPEIFPGLDYSPLLNRLEARQ
ncbi:hypothetical protein ACPESV_36100 [Streptomyces umbrinus]|uniref:hypothetical protein n=1 Tax=Streptomyces umbrinus TaxID=67370 RepID=UPI003C2DE9F3